ncbi:MAG: chorismate mutase [Bifidobacteriaceae bacterium]|nr:chorismate mutase [Bifidobacteriaceae bacterium]
MSDTSNGTGEWPQGQVNTSSQDDTSPTSTGTDQQATTIEAADTPQTHEAVRKIEALRATIDNIDAAVVHLLAERFKATSQVGVLKAQAGFAPADLEREEQQLERLRRIAQDAGLDTQIAEMYKQFVVEEAKKRHRRIAEAGGDPGVLDVYA